MTANTWGTLRKLFAHAGRAVSPELGHITSIEDWRYVTALLLLPRADLSIVSVWHPSFFRLLLQEIGARWDQLLSDISDGTCAVIDRLPPSVTASIELQPNSRQSKDLRAVSSLAADQLWPKLEVVSCWADGHAAGAAAELAQSLGRVAIQPKGLIATEGIISIPFEGRHPLAIRSHYFEFEDESGRVWRSSELQQMREYNLILTTGGGLYRYRLED